VDTARDLATAYTNQIIRRIRGGQVTDGNYLDPEELRAVILPVVYPHLLDSLTWNKMYHLAIEDANQLRKELALAQKPTVPTVA
jgi:hypothetical protein